MTNQIVLTTEIGIIILVAASIVAVITNRFNIPYTIGLVFAGVILSFYTIPQEAQLTKEIIFNIFIPILLFEASFHISSRILKRTYVQIALLATLGVVLSFFVVAILMHFGLNIPWEAAFLFAALIAATDPVSVVAFFKRVRVSRTLTTMVEGESIFNDGTAAVLFVITLALIESESSSIAVFALTEFTVLVVGGVVVGALLGYLTSILTRRIDDYLVEITMSVILAYSAFLVADLLHFSGIISVAAAGIILGNFGHKMGMGPTTKVTLVTFWEFATFIVNSIIFVMIGLEILSNDVVSNLGLIFGAFIFTLIARAISVYGLSTLLRPTKFRIPASWQHVLFLGGLRGTIALALALSIPADYVYRELILTTTFGVVFLSLIGQGFLIEPLVNSLKLLKVPETKKMLEKEGAKLQAVVGAKRKLHELHTANLVTELDYLTLYRQLNDKEEMHRKISDALLEGKESAIAESILKTKVRLLYAERDAIQNLLNRNKIGTDTCKQLLQEIDREIDQLNVTN